METQMKKQQRTIIAMLFLLSITGAFNVLGETDGNKYTAKGDILVPTKEISKYKSWLKVTPRPHQVKLTIDGIDGLDSWDLAPIIGDDKKRSKEFKKSIKPAAPVYSEVYINEIAAKAAKQNRFLFTEPNDYLEENRLTVSNKIAEDAFRFPTGSIIVREKIVAKGKLTVESLAVMIKRESSFNPQSDGWQFLFLDPKTLAITKNDQVICLSCHTLRKETDFVFNSYGP